MNGAIPKNETILLWPEGAPGSESWTQVEEEILMPPGFKVVRNVTQPHLTVYSADPIKANGTAVIICPGGGWHYLSIVWEGSKAARWLARRGVTAFVLCYRLIRTGDNLIAEMDQNMSDRSRLARLLIPLLPLAQADGQQALRLVRDRAAEWGIVPDRVGMLGFSAGGMLTANAALYNPPDLRPTFAAGIYAPVFEDVTAPLNAPPLFLACANDDELGTVGSLRLYSAWRAVQSPVELHIYSTGGHGFGMNHKALPCDSCIRRLDDWLQVQGLLERQA
jgi:acetyl esterase/lipase